LATSSDLKLKKVALRALADIGDLSSAPILKAEAKKAGYSFEPTDATASYLLLIQSAARNGNALFVEESCEDIVDNQSIPVQTRSAALRILVKAASNKSTPELQKALKSSDIEYRTDAENLLAEIKQTVPYQLSDEEAKEGFVPLFNGLDMKGWVGNTTDYIAQHGEIICRPSDHGSGNLYTEKEYADFTMRFEFQLTPGANNGLGIRTPLEGDAAYVGMELQILDNEADIYKDLKPYQYHGSVYGVIPAKRGFQKPVGEWNYQEVQCVGNKIKVILNGEVILDGDIAEASKNGTETADHKSHPGLLNKSGHIGFLGHGSPLKFRNLRIFSK
jgi:hypothetical protein